MIYHLDLALRDGASFVRDRLETGFSWLKERGYMLCIEERVSGNGIVMTLTLCGPDHSGVFQDQDIISIFHYQLAELLSEIITLCWEGRLIRRRIEKEYRSMPANDQLAIACRAREFMRQDNDNEALNMILKFGRKSRISNRISEYLHGSNTMNVDGMVNFRLKDYLREIRFAVDLAYEDLKNEKQFNEFVRLLKHYVDSQAPKVIEVHLMWPPAGTFSLWNEKGVSIEHELNDICLTDLLDSGTSLDDILISLLINLAPRRLVFHAGQELPDNEPMRIIRRVFQDRLSVCGGCPRCRIIPAGTPVIAD